MRRFITLDVDDKPPLVADVVRYWNGFAVPALTADDLAAYYRRIGITDARIVERDDIMSLVYADDVGLEPTQWQAVATDDRGRNVYHVDGLIWDTLDDDDEILEAVAHYLDDALAADDHTTRDYVTRRVAAGDVAGLTDLYAWHIAN